MENTTSQASRQQRRYLRARVDLPISFSVNSDSAATFEGRARDLGGGGLRLETEEDLPQGAVVTLRFSVPTGRHEMMMRGRIVLSFFNASTKQYGHGIAFTQIAPDDQDSIVTYVNEFQRLELQGH